MLGGKWGSAGVGYTCTVYVGTPSAWCGNVIGPGEAGWGPSVFNIYPASAGFERASAVVDQYDNVDWFGAVTHSPSQTSGTYTYSVNRISHFNTTNTGGLHARFYGYTASTADKACTSAHEWGHVIGLAHHSSTPGTVMRTSHTDRCYHSGVSAPASHDFADVDYLY